MRPIVPIAVALLPSISSLLGDSPSPPDPCRRTRNLLRCRPRLGPREQDNIRGPRSRPRGGGGGVSGPATRSSGTGSAAQNVLRASLPRAVLLELPVERLPAHPEHAGGERLVAADRLHHAQDVSPFDLLERRQLRRVVARHEHVRAAEAADLLGKILDADRVPARERDGPLDAVLELADVPGPDV